MTKRKVRTCTWPGCDQTSDEHQIVTIHSDSCKTHYGWGTVRVIVMYHFKTKKSWAASPGVTRYFRGSYREAYRRARNAARKYHGNASNSKIVDYVTDFGKTSKEKDLAI